MVITSIRSLRLFHPRRGFPVVGSPLPTILHEVIFFIEGSEDDAASVKSFKCSSSLSVQIFLSGHKVFQPICLAPFPIAPGTTHFLPLIYSEFFKT